MILHLNVLNWILSYFCKPPCKKKKIISRYSGSFIIACIFWCCTCFLISVQISPVTLSEFNYFCFQLKKKNFFFSFFFQFCYYTDLFDISSHWSFINNHFN